MPGKPCVQGNPGGPGTLCLIHRGNPGQPDRLRDGLTVGGA